MHRTGSGDSSGCKVIPGKFIAVLKDSGDVDGAADDVARGNGQVTHKFQHALKGVSFDFPGNAQAQAQLLERIRSRTDVRVVTQDCEVKALGAAAPLVTSGTQALPTGARRVGAVGAKTAAPAADVAVAVLDTGVSLDHPDLNVIRAHTVFRVIGKNKPGDDRNGHGTHCAGIIGAKNDAQGVIGVAPGTKIVAVQVLDSTGSGSITGITSGIDWVTANAVSLNIKVISMSLGGDGNSTAGTCASGMTGTYVAMRQAICGAIGKNITVVVAAGNDNANLATTSPASFPEVLTVTAMADSDGTAGGIGGTFSCRTAATDDTAASFSNWASPTDALAISHTIAAPGVCINSTWLGSTYNTISGTSMATPYVAGIVALCHSNGGQPGPCAGKTPAQIIALIRSDAQAHTQAMPGGKEFNGDPSNPLNGGYYYGYLAWAGTYVTGVN